MSENGIVRVEKSGNFSVMSNEFLRRGDLSYRAKGIMAYLLSKPDDWQIRVKDIQRSGKEGRDAVAKAMKELKALGYLERVLSKDPKSGKIVGWSFILYETPKTVRLENRSTEKPYYGKSDPTKDLVVLNTEKTKDPLSDLTSSELKKYSIEEIPLLLRTKRFITAWIIWNDHLKDLKKKQTPSMMTHQLRKLERWGEEAGIIAIGWSASNGWKGLFPPKESDQVEESKAFLTEHGILFHVEQSENTKASEPEGWEPIYEMISGGKQPPRRFLDLAPHWQQAIKEKIA